MFKLTTVFTLTAGTMLLVWLSNQITARGIGNGLALILAVGLVVEFAGIVAVGLERVRQGLHFGQHVRGRGAVWRSSSPSSSSSSRARGARSPSTIPEQTSAARRSKAGRRRLMLKINSAGLIPTVFAGWLMSLSLPASLSPAAQETAMFAQLGHGHPLFMAVFGVLVVLLTLFYTAS